MPLLGCSYEHPSLKPHDPMNQYYSQHFVGKEIKAQSNSPKITRWGQDLEVDNLISEATLLNDV